MKKKLLLVAGLFISAVTIASLNFYGSSSAAVPGNNVLVTMNHTNTAAKSASSNGTYAGPDMSKDGRFATYITTPTDDALATAVSVNQAVVRNLQTNTNELASVSGSGAAANAAVSNTRLSETGQYLVFASNATNLTSTTVSGTWAHVYIRDRTNNTTAIVDTDASGNLANSGSTPLSVSNDGRFVLFITSSTNFAATAGQNQIFLKDMETGSLQLISKSATGAVGNGYSTSAAMSCDGSFVAFASDSNNLTPNDVNLVRDAFLVDLRNGFKITNLTEQRNDGGTFLDVRDVSCNGTYVAFEATGPGIIAETLTAPSFHSSRYHVYVYNRLTKTMTIADRARDGSIMAEDSLWPSVNDNGLVSFISRNWNLLTLSNRGKYQAYIRDTKTGSIDMVSVVPGGGLAAAEGAGTGTNGIYTFSRLSNDGKRVMYMSASTDLTSTSDLNLSYDFYLSETGY